MKKEINRSKIGQISGIIGIICNCVLSATKIFAGAVSGSLSVTADGLNNLSDAASSVVAFLGYRLSEKPADKKHPFGHARIEYLANLTVATLMLFMGFELTKSSVIKMISTEKASFSVLTFIILAISIAVKIFMMLFNRHMGKKISSATLMAVAADSRNDAIATTVVALSAATEYFFNIKVDGIAGLLLALFILYSGIITAKGAVSTLLGEGGSPKLKNEITALILSNNDIIGCHDLIVHDYGPEKIYASIHVEMNKNATPMYSHRIIDLLERKCLKRLGVHLVIHHAPVATDDPGENQIRQAIEDFLSERDPRLKFHDLRIVERNTATLLYFDIEIPEEIFGERHSIALELESHLNESLSRRFILNITYDI